MRVLVTGGTGYLGRALVRAVAAAGHEVLVFSRSASRSGLPATPIDGDVRDKLALERAAQRCDALMHSAALVSIWRRRRQDFDDINVGGLRNALAAAAAAGISRIVYTSSFLALPPHGETATINANDYQRTKVAADAVAAEAVREGSPIVRVYPGVVYGPGSFTEGNLLGRLIADHMRRRLPALIGPEKRWSFAYVDDVAAGHCAALGTRHPRRAISAGRRECAAATRIRNRRAIDGPPPSDANAIRRRGSARGGGRTARDAHRCDSARYARCCRNLSSRLVARQ